MQIAQQSSTRTNQMQANLFTFLHSIEFVTLQLFQIVQLKQADTHFFQWIPFVHAMQIAGQSK